MAKKTEKEEKESSKLQETLDLLNKKYGEGSVMELDSKNKEKYDIISSGSIGLDWLSLGIGGFAKGKLYELIGWEGTGKAQPLTSKILTPNGWKTMGEMEIGSIISTPDGKNSTVIGIYPQGKQDIYKITFDDKTYTNCTLDHLWYTNTRGTEIGDILSTRDLLEIGLKKANGCRAFKIPTTKPLEFEQFGKITIDPYLLGLLLGDGGLTQNTVRISSVDDEILNEIRIILKNKYKNLELSHKQGLCNYSFRKIKRGHGKSEIWEEINNLNLLNKFSYEKHIPKEYLLTSVENRISLLQGLMDSDGSVEDGTLSYSTTSLKLNKDFEFLVRSLGFRCTTSSRITKYNSATGQKVDGKISYRSTLLMNTFLFMPFRLSRKKNKVNSGRSLYSERFIESIEKIGNEECQCIAIGHPDKLYITDDFIVTHNTTICGHVTAECQKNGGKVAYIDGEHALDTHYFRSLGVDTSKLIVSQPSHGEEGFNIAIDLINSGELDLLIIDSDSSLIPKSVLDGEVGDSAIGKKARLNSNAYPKLKSTLSNKNTCVIVVSQYREKIGQLFGDPRTTQGGHALKFYSDCRIEISKSLAKDGDVNYGNITKIKPIKNKMSPPYINSQFEVLFGKGIDKTKELLELASDNEVIKKWGKTITFEDTKYEIDEFTKKLEDPKFFNDLKAKVVEKIKNSETKVEEA